MNIDLTSNRHPKYLLLLTVVLRNFIDSDILLSNVAVVVSKREMTDPIRYGGTSRAYS